jgi:hypothetical protein
MLQLGSLVKRMIRMVFSGSALTISCFATNALIAGVGSMRCLTAAEERKSPNITIP